MAKSSTRRVTIYINGKEVEASVKQIRSEMNKWIIRSMTTQFHGRKASSFSEHDHPKTVLKP